jgi:hypothetical protein
MDTISKKKLAGRVWRPISKNHKPFFLSTDVSTPHVRCGVNKGQAVAKLVNYLTFNRRKVIIIS